MVDPKKKRYFYAMLAGFGAIGLSIFLFFLIYRLEGIGHGLKKIGDVLAPFVYGGVVAYLLRPLCNLYERILRECLPGKTRKAANAIAVDRKSVV